MALPVQKNQRLNRLDDLERLEYKEATVLEEYKRTMSGILSGVGSLEFPGLPGSSLHFSPATGFGTMTFGTGFEAFPSHLHYRSPKGYHYYMETFSIQIP